MGEVRRLLSDLQIPEKFSRMGVTGGKIPEMAADAMRSGHIAVNPGRSSIQNIEMLYRKAIQEDDAGWVQWPLLVLLP